MKQKLQSLIGGICITGLLALVSGLSYSSDVSKILLWHAWLFSTFVYLFITGEASITYWPNPIGRLIFFIGFILGIPIYSFIIYLRLSKGNQHLK